MKDRKNINVILLLLILFSLGFYPFLAGAGEPGPEALAAFEAIQNQMKESETVKTAGKNNQFSWRELWLELPPDAVLATRQGEPLVRVDEFNQRVGNTFGEDLYHARYQALRTIIDNKLVAGIARKQNFEYDPSVIKRLSQAETDMKAMQFANEYRSEVTDEQIRQYYKKNINQFKLADKGTKVLFVVKADRKEAEAVMARIKKGEDIGKFSLSPDPVPGYILPAAVQDAIFNLEPGQLTGIIDTPIGFYIAKLAGRNIFDQFSTSIIVKNSLEQAQQALKRIEAGENFESLVAEKEQLSVDLKDLPKEVQSIIPDMDIKQISYPIRTPLGYFLVKLQEHKSSADILSAKLIPVNSKDEGNMILSRLRAGLNLEKTEEHEVSGKELPEESLEVAKTLNLGEYSAPVKTKLGYYLVMVQKRAREMYVPFDMVKEEAGRMLKAEAVSDQSALNYYNFYRSRYRKSGPEYIVDIILSDNSDQAEKMFSELQKAHKTEEKEALFAGYQKKLKSVPSDLLPAACQDVAKGLKPGQLSSVISTPLGYFIIRLNKKSDQAYVPFEEVKYSIKCLLSEQNEQRYKRAAEIGIAQAEEDAMAMAYYQTQILQSASLISDKEAERWWHENKDNFTLLDIPELRGDNIKFANPQQAMKFKKENLMGAKHKAMLEDLYSRNNVVIYENLLQ